MKSWRKAPEEDPEQVSSYPRFSRGNLYFCCAGVAVWSAGTGIFLMLSEYWMVLLSALMAATHPPTFYRVMTQPTVRIGRDWIEVAVNPGVWAWREWRTGRPEMRRLPLADIVGVVSEDRISVTFRLAGGETLRIRSEWVKRGDWDALRAELGYRLDCYEPLQEYPPIGAPERAKATPRAG